MMKLLSKMILAGVLLLAACGNGLVGKTVGSPKDLIAAYPDYLLMGTIGKGAGPFTVTSEEVGKSGQSHSYQHEAYLAYGFRVIHCENRQGKEKVFVLRTIRKVNS